ncbi:MAG: InlB B-repeat-containing protein [Oscillospiraceae bacterium]|jgi:hypothetical protein|nr:InlB B-repeat-containing protein [Oscillospiraceae bacterium]
MQSNTRSTPQGLDYRDYVKPEPTAEDYIGITDMAGLLAMSAGNSYKLENNITITNNASFPINIASGSAITFDGQGYSIQGLTRPLFKTLPTDSIIQNVKLPSVNIRIASGESGLNVAGALICTANGGASYSKISNVTVSGTLTSETANAILGGIVGKSNQMLISNCTSSVNVTCTQPTMQCVGGIVGESNYDIMSCVNSGVILAEGSLVVDNNYTGGIVGKSTGGSIGASDNGCVNQNSVSGSWYAGGIAGIAEAIRYCVNAGNVTGDRVTGGIAGQSALTEYCVVKSVAIQGREGGDANTYTGGIAGVFTSGKIEHCRCEAVSVKNATLYSGDHVARIAANYRDSSFDSNKFKDNCANPSMILYGAYLSGNLVDNIALFASYGQADDPSKAYGANYRNGVNCDPAASGLYIVMFDKQNTEANTMKETDGAGVLAWASFPPDPLPPIVGTEFIGWFDENGDQVTGSYSPGGNKTLTARYKCTTTGTHYVANTRSCEANVYTVTYYNDGMEFDSDTVEHGGKLTEPDPPPEDENASSFKGWYIKGSQTRWDFNKSVTGDMDLISHFNCNAGYHLNDNLGICEVDADCKVTFVTPAGVDAPSPFYYKCAEDTTIDRPALTVPKGNRLKGWYNGSQEWNFYDYATGGNMTLTAHFECDEPGYIDSDGNELTPCVFDGSKCPNGYTPNLVTQECDANIYRITVTGPGGPYPPIDAEHGKPINQQDIPRLPNVPGSVGCAWYAAGASTEFDFTQPITGPINLMLKCSCGLGYASSAQEGCTFTGCPTGYYHDEENGKCLITVETVFPNGQPPPRFDYYEPGPDAEYTFPACGDIPHGKFIGWSVQPLTGAFAGTSAGMTAEQAADSGDLHQPYTTIPVTYPMLMIPVFQGDPGWECDENVCVFTGKCPDCYELNEAKDDCVSDGTCGGGGGGGGGNGGGSINLPQNIVNALGNVMDSIGNMENAAGDLLGSYKLMFDKSLTFSKNPETDMVETSHMVERMVEALSELESSLSSKLCCSVKVLSACGCAETR